MTCGAVQPLLQWGKRMAGMERMEYPTMQTVLTIELISTDPTVRNGQPCIAGTGLRVTDVVMAHLFHGRASDEIAVDYELALAQVYAALAYYYIPASVYAPRPHWSRTRLAIASHAAGSASPAQRAMSCVRQTATN